MALLPAVSGEWSARTIGRPRKRPMSAAGSQGPVGAMIHGRVSGSLRDVRARPFAPDTW
jgi:hypothetical protein